MTAYAGGLRVSEVTHLRVRDVDGRRMMLRIQQGKGRQDRYVMLSHKFFVNTGNSISQETGCLPGRIPNDP